MTYIQISCLKCHFFAVKNSNCLQFYSVFEFPVKRYTWRDIWGIFMFLFSVSLICVEAKEQISITSSFIEENYNCWIS